MKTTPRPFLRPAPATHKAMKPADRLTVWAFNVLMGSLVISLLYIVWMVLFL